MTRRLNLGRSGRYPVHHRCCRTRLSSLSRQRQTALLHRLCSGLHNWRGSLRSLEPLTKDICSRILPSRISSSCPRVTPMSVSSSNMCLRNITTAIEERLADVNATSSLFCMYSIIYIVGLTPSSVMPQLLVQQIIILHSEWHIREALLSSQRVSSSSPNRLSFLFCISCRDCHPSLLVVW